MTARRIPQVYTLARGARCGWFVDPLRKCGRHSRTIVTLQSGVREARCFQHRKKRFLGEQT